MVALRKESVDRNCVGFCLGAKADVALRKESVDRNFYYADKDADWVRSLSARRAWIEIIDNLTQGVFNLCRSPQGERG